MNQLLESTEAGLYCRAGGFYIDPWRPVDLALITHAHSDHARPGCGRYLTCREGESLVRTRLGEDARIETIEFGEPREAGGVRVSFHPAGHIRGSAQVRIEYRDQVVVVSGDFKRNADPTCTGFEVVPCDVLVTESTFALPIYRWPDPGVVVREIENWWRGNQQSGKTSLLYAYALGKAQRLLASIDASIGPVYTHGAVERLCQAYRADGVALPETQLVVEADRGTDWSRGLVVAPPSAHRSRWSRRLKRVSTGLVSGWMRVRGMRRRRSIDRGFVLSDHADWPDLLRTIEQTGAKEVVATHGYTAALARYLGERGYDARAIETQFRGEAIDDGEASEAEA